MSFSLCKGIGSVGPIDVLAELFDLFHRPGFDVLEAARRLAQAERQRAQELLGLDAESARLRAAILHQNVAEPEARLLDDVLEQNGLIALRRQRADVVHAHRLFDPGDDVGIGFEITAERGIETLIAGFAIARPARPQRDPYSAAATRVAACSSSWSRVRMRRAAMAPASAAMSNCGASGMISMVRCWAENTATSS